MLALQIKHCNDIYNNEACKKANNNFHGLIEDILEDLPSKTKNWTKHDQNRVAEALWQKSYAEEFQQNLRQHITQHFPQLVIPQIIEQFNIDAGNAITEWATQTTIAILNSSEEGYQKECEKISQHRLDIELFLEISDKNLKEPFEGLKSKVGQAIVKQSEDNPVNDVISDIRATIYNLQRNEPYSELKEKLFPLYSWEREFQVGINQVLELVANSLETGRVNWENPTLKKANILQVNLLVRNLIRLVKLGYTASVAKEGKIIEAKTDVEKNNLKTLNEELNELAIHLNIVIADVLKQISTQELNRIYQAVSELFRCHLSYLEKEANDIVPNLGINLPNLELSKVDSNLSFQFQFRAGFAVTKGTWQEPVQVSKERRTWYTLWLGKKTIYEYKYETRSSDNAEIPSIEDLLTSWIIGAKEKDSERVNQIAGWILEQIDCLKKKLNKIHNDIIDRYQERLDKANQEITLDYEKQKNVWLPMQQKSQKLAEYFSELESFHKSNT